MTPKRKRQIAAAILNCCCVTGSPKTQPPVTGSPVNLGCCEGFNLPSTIFITIESACCPVTPVTIPLVRGTGTGYEGHVNGPPIDPVQPLFSTRCPNGLVVILPGRSQEWRFDVTLACCDCGDEKRWVLSWLFRDTSTIQQKQIVGISRLQLLSCSPLIFQHYSATLTCQPTTDRPLDVCGRGSNDFPLSPCEDGLGDMTVEMGCVGAVVDIDISE